MFENSITLLLLVAFAPSEAAPCLVSRPSPSASRELALPPLGGEPEDHAPEGREPGGDDPEDEAVERARASEERLHRLALETMPSTGWRSLAADRALLIASKQCGSLRTAGRDADAALDWLDATFGELRTVPYTRAPILRIFETPDALAAYEPEDSAEFAVLERLACMSPDLPALFPLTVNSELLSYWLDEHCPDLMLGLPGELNLGLRSWVMQSRFKGRRVTPAPKDIFVDSVRASSQQGEALDLRAALTVTRLPAASPSFDPDDPIIPGALGFLLVDHFLAPKSKASDELRQTFLRFLVAIRDGLAEAEASAGAEDPGPTTMEDLQVAHQRVTTAAFEATFGAMNDEAWASFEQRFRKEYRLR